jgi:hypothetical protein
MQERRGKWIRLSAHRIMICDLMQASRQVPSVPVQRRMRLGAVSAARHEAEPRPSWPVVFAKAFAIVAGEVPELRRCYLALPWARLYEHPISVASVAVEKSVGPERARGREKAVFFAKLRRPNEHRLPALDRYLKRFAGSPSANMGLARLGLWISLLPWPLRRFLWWYSLNAEGYFRARQFGTFGVSVYSALGAESLHPLSPLSFVLNYGVFDEQGDVDVRLVYDHRVLDGATVARALTALESALSGPILEELRLLAPARA